MNRNRLDKSGILSPPGPFLTPSPSSQQILQQSISPSPVQLPFQFQQQTPIVQQHQHLQQQQQHTQDGLLVVTTNNTTTFVSGSAAGTTTTHDQVQDQGRVTKTPNRRSSLTQSIQNSPNAGGTAVTYRPSPTQSPAHLSTSCSSNTTTTTTTFNNISNSNNYGTVPVGHEFNTTLVGSNNISLNKKGNKRNNVGHHAGHASSINNTSGNLCSPKASKKVLASANMVTRSPIASPSPISSPNPGLRPPTPQPMMQMQPFPVMGASNQVLQIIQGPQLIQQRPLLAQNQQVASSTNQQIIAQQTTTTTTLKHNKVPQQILPKPASGTTTTAMAQNIIQQTTTTKTVVTQAKTAMPVQPQPQQFISTQQATGQGQNHPGGQQQGPGQILLPHGATQLNAQPLLLNQLNQMPVIVQQNTPQGVQLILRPQAPQLTTAPAGLVIHNTRPQTHQIAQQSPHPQQLLRILNANGTMQFGTAPTFIVSSQANHLIQQNLQTIKTNNGSPTIAQLGSQNARQGPQQQLAAAINNHILGQQFQNLQMNGNIAHLQMPNGLTSGQFLSQLPPGFTTTTTHQQATTGININQLANQNLTQIAAAAAASQTFQSPPPPSVTPVNDFMPTIQFNTQPGSGSSGNVTPVSCTTPQPQHHVISSPQQQNMNFVDSGMHQQQSNVILGGLESAMKGMQQQQQQTMVQEVHPIMQEQVKDEKPAKKPKKQRQKKGSNPPPVVSVAPTIMASPPHSPPVQATGKLDLANVMKLCGIMEDDDEMETEENAEQQQQIQDQTVSEQNTQQNNQSQQSQIIGQQVSGDSIMITIPGGTEQNPGTMPITFSIPSAMAEEQGLIPGQEGKGDFMITIDPTVSGESQPYTISIPRTVNGGDGHLASNNTNEKDSNSVPLPQQVKQHCTVAPTIIQPQPVNCSITSTASAMCVPTFVNSVLSSNVTPTLQSQINEIQNQLMAAATPIQTTTTSTTPAVSISPPKPKKRANNKKNKNKDKSNDIPVIASVAPMVQNTNHVLTTSTASIPNVPTQIGNIQISQVDGTIKNNHINSQKNINNQIQITPIMTDNKQQVPVSSPPVSHVITSSTPSPRVQTPINVITSQANTQLVQSMPQVMSAIPQMIATNMPQQAIQLSQTLLPTAIQVPQNPTAQQLMQQLTGHLSLSLAEDRRLLLKHDVNTPQDAQSQMILQTILSGALGNVTLVHEPSNKQQQQQQQPKQMMTQGHLLPGSIITTSGGNVGHVIPQTQMFPIGAMQHSNNGQLTQQKDMIKLQNDQAQTILINQNIPKIVELPKIGPNQQLFSLNTLNNQITQLSPDSTTAALGPMERLLIVPSGISPQQLAQCLIQGQIHFNNIEQGVPQNSGVDPNKMMMQNAGKQINNNSNQGAKTQNHIPKVCDPPKQKEEKPKRCKLKKIKSQDSNKAKAAVTPTTNFQTKSNSTAIQLPPANQRKPSNTAIVSPVNSQHVRQQCNTTTTPSQGEIISKVGAKLVNAVPPLVNMSPVIPPRVQTIQLTPQKQQSLKNVQSQIQQLSARLQNKNLLSTITQEYDPTNPLHNKPLPTLDNMDTMTDTDIHAALQRLFIEQQKILSTGKVIPTIPGIATPPTISPIAPNNNTAILTGGGNLPSIASPIQINSPQVKQEVPTLCSPVQNLQSSPSNQTQIGNKVLNCNSTTVTSTSTATSITTTTSSSSPHITGASGFPTPVTSVHEPPPKETPVTSVTMTSPSIKPEMIIKQERCPSPISNLPSPKLLPRVPRPHLFERQISVDQDGCLNPDTKTHFQSKEDAVKRLIRYHCMYESTDEDPAELFREDIEFEQKAVKFQDEYRGMLQKYQMLLMKESTKHVQTAELMMIDRLLLSDIKEEIMEMQCEINAAYNPPAPVIPAPVSDFNEQSNKVKMMKNQSDLLLSPQKSPMLSPGMKSNHSLSSPIGMLQSPNSHQVQNNNSKLKQYSSMSSPIPVASPYMMPNSPLVQQQNVNSQERFPPCMHQNKVPGQPGQIMVSNSHLPMVSPTHQHKQSILMPQNRFYHANNAIDDTRKTKKLNKNLPSVVPTIQEPPKKDMDNFDIESEITPSFIMKNAPVPCEDNNQSYSQNSQSSTSNQDHSPIVQNHVMTSSVSSHESLQDDTIPSHHSSPLKDMNNSSAGSDDMDIDYFGNPPTAQIQSNDGLSDFDRLKNETTESNHVKIQGNIEHAQNSEPYDEWLCIQKALEEHNTRPIGHHLDSRGANANDLFSQQQHNKINESQFNELFHDATTGHHQNHDNKLTNDIRHSPPSPFAALFHADDMNADGSAGSSNDSSVKETMGQMYGGDSEEISAKTSEIVESRLEALFEGTNTESEDALDNASFLHKNSQITYEMMQQMQVSITGKRQWQENCEMLPSPTLPPTPNMLFNNTGPNGSSTKRQCLSGNGSGFNDTNSDNARNWMMDCPQDSFEFESISSCESSSQPSSNTQGTQGGVNKWNGDVSSHATTLHQQMQGVMHHSTTSVAHFEHHLTGTGAVNFDEDISQQVQNDLQSAIDNLLNLQETDSLQFSLDQTIGSFLADNGLGNTPNNLSHHNIHPHNHTNHQQSQQQHAHLSKVNQKFIRNPINVEVPNHDIGGCLIGGNLDDSPTGQLQVTTSHHNSNTNSGPTTPISANEYGAGLVDDTVKSIMTS